jgi:predicted heme/steroid binding protein
MVEKMPGADNLQTYTEDQLRRFNGDRGEPKYVACQGNVYDVSECPRWRAEMHERMHFPGQDLSNEIEDAPHADEVFQRPCVKLVGTLID